MKTDLTYLRTTIEAISVDIDDGAEWDKDRVEIAYPCLTPDAVIDVCNIFGLHTEGAYYRGNGGVDAICMDCAGNMDVEYWEPLNGDGGECPYCHLKLTDSMAELRSGIDMSSWAK